MTQVLIGYYKAIEEGSAKMLEAAKAEDWDGVVRFEGVCAVLIEQLRQGVHVDSLDAQARAEKSRIMRRILQNDAQIRYLAEPWLDHFAQKFEGPQFLH
jgi:flagellar protein FliT